MEEKSLRNFLKTLQSSELFSKEFTTNISQRLLYCQQLLNSKSGRKRTIKQWQPKLTSEERILFEKEEILSAYQHVIANSCAEHRQRRRTLSNRLSTEPVLLPIHRFCRKGVHPGTSIQRQQMEDEQVLWSVDFLDYKPPYYTHPSLLTGTEEDADPEVISLKFMWNTFDTNYNVDRRTANPIGQYLLDKQGYPLNPLGRTGLRGRGELKRWAVNYQTHLVIMCGTNEMTSGKEIFKYIMERSEGHHYYRLPSTWTTGTNMSAITKTLRRYLLDIYQSWNHLQGVSQAKIDEIIDHLTFVSTAYIDDSKNTDNAWLETSVCCYIQTNRHQNISSNPRIDLNELFPESALSEKARYTWHRVSHASSLLNSERDLIKLIAKRYNAFW